LRRNKKELQDEYNRLLAARKLSDPESQKAEIVIRDLRNLYNETLRRETENHAGRIRLESQIRRLHQKRNALHTNLLESNPEYSKLHATRSERQSALAAKRRQIEQRIRSSAAYRNAEAQRVAAGKAMEDHKKRTIEGKQAEIEKLDTRIQELHKQAQAPRENALKKAGLTGRNPYPGRGEARMLQAQLNLTYHSTADWENRTPEEVDGTAPPKLKKWLKEVRGY